MTKVVVFLTIDDAEHIPAEHRAAIVAGYPAHEREARAMGVPMLGSGRVFPISEEAITCRPFPLPPFYACIGGLDFGWDHPTAAVKLAWDRDDDIVYVVECYREREATPTVHAAEIRPWGGTASYQWLPWAWPHDAHQHDKGSGASLADQYRREGLRLLATHATHEAGGFGIEAGIMEMLARMETGRLKVFAHLKAWFEEFRLYHRKDGRVVKENDDIMSATRIGIMSLRFAKPPSVGRRPTHRPTNRLEQVL
ncbi:MAG: terminase [Rhodospirillaceae bacterium]|nr:terminase [Rhodospirillaceae bacterium]